ncbi:Hypothetical predicted protein [Cloeon dipterum]|nr:Hypothetical predicted protein [Cloeon dipterum]
MLECKEFLQIQPEALAFFLTLEELNIDSEFTLVKACIRYAKFNGKCDEEVRDLFQKYALPHLRVLTLTYQQLLKVNDFLSLEQSLFLHDNLQNKEPLLTVKDLPEIEKSFSLSKKRRFPNTCCTLTVVPEEEVLPLTTVFKEGMFSVLPWEQNKFVIAFDATTKFVIKRIEVFCPLDLRGESDYLDENLMKRLRESEIDCDSKTTTHLTVTIKIRHKKKENNEEFILHKPKEHIYLNSQWASFYGTIKVPASTRVKLKVSFNGRVSLRHFERNVERMIQENDRCVRKLFGNVELDQFYKDGENGVKWVRKDGITVFKDIYVCPCDKPDVFSPAEKILN